MYPRRECRPASWLYPALAVAGGVALLKFALQKPRYSFADKVVIITGGARGLGLVMARRLAREGATLIICSRNSEQLRRAADELSKNFGARILPIACDVANEGQAEQLIATAIQEFGRIDVLINDAGTIQVGPYEEMDVVDYQKAMEVHFWGPLYLIRAVVPHMKRRGVGRIVNVSSIGGRVSVPHLVPYSASKFALVGLSEGLRAELAKDGILVTTVSPGLMRTGSPRNAIFKGQHKAEHAWFAIGDSLPLLSMSAEAAAKCIIEACRQGTAAVTLSLPAKAAHLFHGIFPGLTSDIMAIVNRMLPAPGGIGHERRRGAASQSAAAPSLLTALSDAAAKRNNQF
jgi:NAD(P)-dependent dehydrogenase (short-subunit alcohol dehydrogenase family)